MKRIRTEMKNSENNKQMASHYHSNQKTDQAPKRPKGSHITRATTITTNSNT